MRKYLLTILLLPLSLLITPAAEFDIKDLSSGMWSNPSSNRIPDNAAPLIQNFYTDVESIAIERNGYEKRDSTALGDPNAVEGLWEFVDNSGNQWIVSFSSRTFYKNLIGDTPTAFGPVMTVAQIPECVDNLGKFMCVNATDDAWTFDGTSTAAVSGAPLGKLIVPWRNRFVIANIGNSQSTVRFSADGDETDWTLGGLATDPFSIQIGGANDGFNVTCMWGSYLDNLIIARKKDIWATAGFDQLDVVTRNVSSEIGCIQNGSIREFDGSLIFLSNRGLEEMRGAIIQHISEPIRDITDPIVGNTSQERRNIQTTQTDWNAGTSDTETWISAGIVLGSIQLATQTARADFVDTDGTDFASGTLTNITTQTISGSIELANTTQEEINLPVSGGITSACQCDDDPSQHQQFIMPSSPATSQLDNVQLRFTRSGNPGCSIVASILSDNSNAPGTELASSDAVSCNTMVNGFRTFSFNSNVSLTASTSYWIKVQYSNTSGCVFGIADVAWSFSTTASPFTENFDCEGIDNDDQYLTIVNVTTFSATGEITSQSFDMGFETTTWLWQWGTLSATELLNNQTITYEVQSATSATGTFSTLEPVTNGGTITSTTTPIRRFIRYVSTFTTTDISTSPIISSITITSGDLIRPLALFTSQVFSIGSAITAWGPVGINDTVSGDGASIVYQFNSTGSADINDFQEADWEDVTSGAVPTITTNTFAVFRATFTILISTEVVRLADFTTNWSEGDIQPLKSWVYDRRYWLSYTTATASDSRNDKVLIYQRNRTFSLLKGINAGSFAIWRDNLYFGDAEDNGFVYLFDVGNNDDGADIDSQILFKSYDLGVSNQEKDFRNLYVNYKSGAAGSLSMSYEVDRDGNSFSLGSANMNEETGQVSAKFPFPLSNPVQGRELQYTLTKTGTGDRLKLYDLKTEFSILEAR